MNKKGDIAYPLYSPFLIALLVIILIFFSVYFFVLGIAKSEASIISGAEYKDSTLLLNILRTEIKIDNGNFTIAESINIASKSEQNSNKVKKQIDGILLKLTRPKGSSTGFWVLEARKNNNVFLQAGEKANLGSEYLEQSITIPSDVGEPLVVRLYLSCRSCKEETLEVLS